MPTYLFLRRLRRSPAAFSGLTLVILLVLTALFAPWLAPHDPNWQDAAARLQGPGAGHWLGTDSYGRDLLSRLLYGTRPALGLVALVTAITLPVGLLVGILSGYYGGWLERILMRFTDVVMSMPRLILAFAFVAMLGPGLVNGALALALTTWPAYARQARSEIQRLRHSDYLAAAEMLGIRGWRLLIGHILPLCLPSAIVRLALDLAGIILAAAGLGFLGLGARPPMAAWGAMIADGMQVIFDQWWIAAIPGAAEHLFYGEWIRGYASEEYAATNQTLIELMDSLAADAGEEQLAYLTDVFVNCSRYELGFWDMAWDVQS